MIDTSDDADAICGTLVKILFGAQNKEVSESGCPSVYNIYDFEANIYYNENYTVQISATKQDYQTITRAKDLIDFVCDSLKKAGVTTCNIKGFDILGTCINISLDIPKEELMQTVKYLPEDNYGLITSFKLKTIVTRTQHFTFNPKTCLFDTREYNDTFEELTIPSRSKKQSFCGFRNYVPYRKAKILHCLDEYCVHKEKVSESIVEKLLALIDKDKEKQPC
jgi:hypothetical protein